jgi:hypothetical protein
MSLFDTLFGPGFGAQPVREAPAPASPPRVDPDHIKRVTIAQLIERKDSIVRINGKAYRVRVTEVEITR